MSKLFGGAVKNRPSQSDLRPRSKMERILSYILGRKSRYADSGDRVGCFIEASINIGEDDYWAPGYILKLSSTTALFRPESAYLLKRNGEKAVIEAENRSLMGIVDESRPNGYRIYFSKPMTTSDHREWMSLSRRQEAE